MVTSHSFEAFYAPREPSLEKLMPSMVVNGRDPSPNDLSGQVKIRVPFPIIAHVYIKT